MGGSLHYNPRRPDGTRPKLTAEQIRQQKAAIVAETMRLWKAPEVIKVLARVPFLRRYVGEIKEAYTKGGVQGFKFVPTNYELLKRGVEAFVNGELGAGDKPKDEPLDYSQLRPLIPGKPKPKPMSLSMRKGPEPGPKSGRIVVPPGGVPTIPLTDARNRVFVRDGADSSGHPDVLGLFMGSDAKKHGFSMSLRSKSETSSVHLEISRYICDAHVDSVSTVAGTSGRPYWGNDGQYNQTRFLDHFIKDLLPFYLEETPRWIPVFGTLMHDKGSYDAITHGLSKTSVEVKLNQRRDDGGKDSRLVFNFSVIEWK
jgi:hypothetical protein